MAYDPELDLLYIGVGNGSPWNRKLRSENKGDNLFLASIVAIRPDTGEYVWHYQTTPGDDWDYTATQHMILADLRSTARRARCSCRRRRTASSTCSTAAPASSSRRHALCGDELGDRHRRDTGRPIENPEARYGITGKPALVTPGPLGGAQLAADELQPAHRARLHPGDRDRVPVSGGRSEDLHAPDRRVLEHRARSDRRLDPA